MCSTALSILSVWFVRYLAIGVLCACVGILIPLRRMEERSYRTTVFKLRLFLKTMFGWPVLFFYSLYNDILYPLAVRAVVFYNRYNFKKPESIY